MSNHSQWLKNIWPDVIHNVGVGTHEQLVIAFHIGYFFLLMLLTHGKWEVRQAGLQRKEITGCESGSKDVCSDTSISNSMQTKMQTTLSFGR